MKIKNGRKCTKATKKNYRNQDTTNNKNPLGQSSAICEYENQETQQLQTQVQKSKKIMKNRITRNH